MITSMVCKADQFHLAGRRLYLFVDGFGRDFGRYRLKSTPPTHVAASVGPTNSLMRLEFGTQCLMDANLGVPTCQ